VKHTKVIGLMDLSYFVSIQVIIPQSQIFCALTKEKNGSLEAIITTKESLMETL